MTLSVSKIKSLALGKKYCDGQGLYLTLSQKGRGKWTYRFPYNQKAHEMGLGSYPDVSLNAARLKRDSQRLILLKGKNPIEVRKAKVQQKFTRDKLRFSYVADKFIDVRKSSWSSPKSERDWRSSLVRYVYPVLDAKPFADIRKKDVLDFFVPLWREKPETAKKIQERVRLVMGYGKALDWCEGDNPAAWKDNLENLCGAAAYRPIKHHKHLPYTDLPKFFKELQNTHTRSSEALQLTILTALRTSELLKVQRHEIDVEKHTLTIPQERMKKRREHVVPLSDVALALIERIMRRHNYAYLFPGHGNPDKSFSNMAMLTLLKKRFSRYDITVHGFRSTFKNWAVDQESCDYHAIEFALAHKLKSREEAAYFHSNLLEKRRKLMQDFANYAISLNPQALRL
jgi:integrase